MVAALPFVLPATPSDDTVSVVTVLMTVGSARAYGMPPSVNAPAVSAAKMRGASFLERGAFS